MFLTKEAVRLATEGVAHAVACEGCPPLAELTDRYLRNRRDIPPPSGGGRRAKRAGWGGRTRPSRVARDPHPAACGGPPPPFGGGIGRVPMNRKQRRAAHSNLQEVARRHRRLVALNPDDAKAHKRVRLRAAGTRRAAGGSRAGARAPWPSRRNRWSSIPASLPPCSTSTRPFAPASRASRARGHASSRRMTCLGPEGLACDIQ